MLMSPKRSGSSPTRYSRIGQARTTLSRQRTSKSHTNSERLFARGKAFPARVGLSIELLIRSRACEPLPTQAVNPDNGYLRWQVISFTLLSAPDELTILSSHDLRDTYV